MGKRKREPSSSRPTREAKRQKRNAPAPKVPPVKIPEREHSRLPDSPNRPELCASENLHVENNHWSTMMGDIPDENAGQPVGGANPEQPKTPSSHRITGGNGPGSYVPDANGSC